MDEKITALIAAGRRRARDNCDAARKTRTSRNVLPALLPASLVPLYLKRLTRAGFNPFRDDYRTFRSIRRQLAMLERECAVSI
jgi:hypothetical protein